MSSIVKSAKIAPSASIVYQFLVFFFKVCSRLDQDDESACSDADVRKKFDFKMTGWSERAVCDVMTFNSN